MAARIKTYIPAPNWDIPPDDTVVLGRLIKDPMDPESVIPKSAVVPVPESAVRASEKTGWCTTSGELRTSKFGLGGTFNLPSFGVGGGSNLVKVSIGLNRTDSALEEHRIDRLETRYFQPEDDYISSSLTDQAVKAYLEATGYRRPLYMITGVKIARGARVATENIRQTTGAAGLPVDVSGSNQTTNSQRGVLYNGSSDYLFAYSLLQIKYKRGKKGPTSNKKYVRGAMFNMREGSDGTDAPGGALRDVFEIEEYELV